MTSVVLFNYNRFNESTLLSSVAYDLSLTIRQAQVYGVASKQSQSGSDIITTDTVANNKFKLGYGVHIDKSSAQGTYPVSLFIDTNGNKIYDPGSFGDTELKSYKFQRGLKIKEICVKSGDTETCGLSSVDVTFIRPDPEATIKSSSINDVISEAKVTLQNADDVNSLTKSVVIYSTGQISVQ